MEDLLDEFMAFEPSRDDAETEKRIKQFITMANKNPLSVLVNSSALDLLDPSVQSIPYLYVLIAHYDAVMSSGKAQPHQLPLPLLPEGSLWPYTTRFLVDFDPVQVRYAGAAFSRIISVVVQGAEQTQNYIPAIQLLEHVILRLDPSSSTLTPTHFHFIRLCLLARAFTDAAVILDQSIYVIPGDTDKATRERASKYLCSRDAPSSAYLIHNTGLNIKWLYKDYLHYYVLGGMCYMGLRQFSKALFFLEVAISAPANLQSCSLIMVEAYKKWLLLGLLSTGKPPSIPKAASAGSMKSIHALAKPYDCLAEAFKNGDVSRLRDEVEQGQEIWNRDFNTSLVLEVYYAFRKFQIVKLGKTFTALSVAEIASLTSPDPTDLNETTAYIQSLIKSGSLNATLTDSSPTNTPPTLRFLPTSTSTAEPESHLQQTLASKTHDLHLLQSHISDNDHRLEISKEYLEMLRKVKKARDTQATKGGDQAGASGAGVPAGTGGFDDLDEDMMAED